MAEKSFSKYIKRLEGGDKAELRYYDLLAFAGDRLDRLPFCLRIFLESCMRNCDDVEIGCEHVEALLDSTNKAEIRFKPARTLFRDLTAIPSLVDFASARDTIESRGGDPTLVEPLCPADLVLDYSQRLDSGRSEAVAKRNEKIEFLRNKELFQFLKWAGLAFKNVTMAIPPGLGVPPAIHFEYLNRIVINEDGLIYPDSVLGTDPHISMMNGMGILAWGLRGIEIESILMGRSVAMPMPDVIGYKIYGKIGDLVTSTDIVLAITKHLCGAGVNGCLVEFFGDGIPQLSVADRTTISNMSPEYGALLAYFPMDTMTMDYFKNTGHFSLGDFVWMEAYLRETHLWREYGDENEESQDPVYSKVVEFDLGTVVATVSGPRKAKDRVSVEKLKAELLACLIKKKELNGFGVLPQDIPKSISFALDKKEFALQHGSVVVAAMSSCTNASNPSVMLGAGLLAKRAIECGLSVPVYIQTSLSPGSSSLTNQYLDKSGVIPFLSQLGFNLSTEKNSCLPLPITESIEKGDIVAVGVLSGNRNFEERVNPLTRANYLASPLLVIAYALAGTVLIDFKDEPLGTNCHGDAVYLKDIWPSRKDIQDVERETVVPALYAEVKAKIRGGNPMWNSLPSHQEVLYPWEQRSLFLKKSPFFEAKETCDVLKGVFVLLWLGDSVTSDHISPAGSIPRQSPAGNYLKSQGLCPREFNSYGARRGHCDVMVRGTFSHPKLVNKLTGTLASKTLYVPTGDTMSIHDAAVKYQCESRPLMILAGKDFGGGSARDWAAKGPYALGVRVILAESFDSGYRACVIAMGILPLEYLPGENASTLRLSGFEAFEIDSPTRPNAIVAIKLDDGRSFRAKSLIASPIEMEYYKKGGMLNHVTTQCLNQS